MAHNEPKRCKIRPKLTKKKNNKKKIATQNIANDQKKT